MKNLVMIFTGISIGCMISVSSIAMYTPIKGTIQQIREQKELVRNQLTGLINELPNSFNNALDLIHNAATDKQWIQAEIAAMANQLFDRVCDQAITDEVIYQNLEQLNLLATRIPDTANSIRENCLLFIERRHAQPHMDAIHDMITTWQTLSARAIRRKARLIEARADGVSAIEQLKRRYLKTILPMLQQPMKKSKSGEKHCVNLKQPYKIYKKKPQAT